MSGRRGKEAGAELAGTDLVFRYPRAPKDAVSGVSARVSPNSVLAVIGPNGSGKSTLARLLAGGLAPRSGTVAYGGAPVSRWGRRELARRVAVVPQSEHVPFPLAVRSLVAMGRYPHLGPWRRERAEDAAAISAALARCGLEGLAGRLVQTLSGGERQRARLARALAQEPRTLIVDEPTAALDMRYEMAIFRLLRALAAAGVAVMVVTHNINLATRFGDRMLLLANGAVAAQGPPDEVVTARNISGAYGWPVTIARQAFPGGDALQVLPG